MPSELLLITLITHSPTSEGWTAEFGVGLWLVVPRMGLEPRQEDPTKHCVLTIQPHTNLFQPSVCNNDVCLSPFCLFIILFMHMLGNPSLHFSIIILDIEDLMSRFFVALRNTLLI